MPINVSWHNEEETIVIQEYVGRWSWEDFYQATTVESATLMKTTNHTVHIFADYSNSQGIPVGGAFTQAYSAMRKYPDNWGILVIVSANRFITTMVDIFKKMFTTDLGAKTFTAATIEEAYDIIANYEAEHATETTANAVY